jgi:predicted TIM-barrel fold metal-dependent hydrolase
MTDSATNAADATSRSVPNSTGTNAPRLKVPANACDCHFHIYDERFPITGSRKRMCGNATVPDFRRLQQRLGTSRAVIVQPAVYTTDNAVTLDAIAQLGPQARGVGVLHPDVTDAELKRLHAGGIRGLRFTIWDPATAVTKVEMIEPLAQRIAELGWHVQLHMMADQLVAHEALFRRLPTQIVVDHLGRLPHPQGIAHPAFGVVRRLLDTGRTWVKLSGAYLDSRSVAKFADTVPVAQAYLRAAPERMVWGSDWPHPTEPVHKPDDAALMDLLSVWAPDERLRHRILVDNPAQLYGFE